MLSDTRIILYHILSDTRIILYHILTDILHSMVRSIYSETFYPQQDDTIYDFRKLLFLVQIPDSQCSSRPCSNHVRKLKVASSADVKLVI
jgi:hypothetical protein